MRIKSRIVVIAVLLFLLLSTLIGSLLLNTKKEDNKENVIDVVDNQDDKQEEIPTTFLNSFDDPYSVDNDIKDLIVNYIDDYYMSIYTLEKVDTTKYFINELQGNISDYAINLLVEVRKLYDYDFTIKKAHYDLTVTRYYQQDDTYYVDVLEDDYMNFAFLNGIESSAYDIENYFVIKKIDDEFKILDLEKVQGYYNAFYNQCDSIDKIVERYNYFYSQLKDMITYNNTVLKQKAENTIYSPSKTYTDQYNRNDAVNYIEQYYHQRSEKWFNYSETGGNCQNYASQGLFAGGIPMDFYGDEQWKCYTNSSSYDPLVDDSESAAGRSRSWVNVGYFYDYVNNNNGSGLVAETGVNINYAEVGDIVIVGNSTLAHTVMISKIVDGHILVNSNSIDMKDFPLDAYTYTNVILVKILGYNQY